MPQQLQAHRWYTALAVPVAEAAVGARHAATCSQSGVVIGDQLGVCGAVWVQASLEMPHKPTDIIAREETRGAANDTLHLALRCSLS